MLQLDHIVFAGKDIGEASAAYGDKFKVIAIKGGEDEKSGTYNYLAHMLNDCYVNWLGVRNFERVKQSDILLHQHLTYLIENDIQGPFQFALRTEKMDKYIEHFKEKNIPFTGPFFNERIEPDGTKTTWKMLFPTYDYTREMLPFLIEWDKPLEKRIDQTLVNSKTITKVDYGGMGEERFKEIYDLSNKKRFMNRSLLKNTKLNFTNSGFLTFDIV